MAPVLAFLTDDFVLGKVCDPFVVGVQDAITLLWLKYLRAIQNPMWLTLE